MEENKNQEIKNEGKKPEKASAYKQPWWKSIYRTYRAEFMKIVWPSKPTLVKHTITVIVVSLLFGAYIALTDGILTILFSRFVGLVT